MKMPSSVLQLPASRTPVKQLSPMKQRPARSQASQKIVSPPQKQYRAIRKPPRPILNGGGEMRPLQRLSPPLRAPHSAPPTQTASPADVFSQSVPSTVANGEFSYVMVNTDDVPKRLESMVDIFYLFDGIRYIVGYCLPKLCYEEYFGEAPPCRVIRAIENVELYQEHIDRFKFQIAPLNVVPMSEPDFNRMISSAQSGMDTNCDVLRNRFYMRPSILRPSSEVMCSVDNSVTQSVVNKFHLSTNPHLIPIRLPDGLECYIRLDLATHCQEDYRPDEFEFGYYHFREVQRDANLTSSSLTVSSPSTTYHHHYPPAVTSHTHDADEVARKKKNRTRK